MNTILLNVNSTEPMYQQIYRYIIQQISDGVLKAGDKMPSTRTLSQNMSISRNTVSAAYDQLVSEGFLEAVEKSGYYVCQISELYHPHTLKTERETTSGILDKAAILDFTPFTVDISHFPYATWRKLYNNCISDMNEEVLQPGNIQGDYRLRESISNYLLDSRGVHCTPEQVIVGAGNDYLIQLLCQLFKEKRHFAMEDPVYIRAYQIIQGFGHMVAPIPVESDGINLSILEHSNCDIAYVTPSHQYPLGVIMPITNRLRLLAWANKKPNRYIIEDDHDSEFRYKGRPIPALQGEDSNGKVIYMGTFSRAIAPGMRVGYMVLPTDLLDMYHKNLSYYSSTVSRVEQAVLANFMTNGYFERHLNKMRKVYKQKHDLVLRCCRIFGDQIEISGENAGLHLVVTFKEFKNEPFFFNFMETQGIRLYDLSPHYIENTMKLDRINALLGFAGIDMDSIESSIHQLNLAIQKYKQQYVNSLDNS